MRRKQIRQQLMHIVPAPSSTPTMIYMLEVVLEEECENRIEIIA
jgi:hypothetical protein